jgi:hypothetical protein
LILPHLVAGFFGTAATFALFLPLGITVALLASTIGGAIGIVLAGGWDAYAHESPELS